MADVPVYELQDSNGTVVGYFRQDIANSETDIINAQTGTTLTVENGRILVDGSEIQGTDTRTDVSKAGTAVVTDTEDINFTESGDATVGVTDDGDGTVTVDISATDTDTDTRTNVSDSGTEVVVDVSDINFATDLSVTDDGDGSVTVNSTASGGGGDASTIQAYAHEWGRF